MIRPLTDDANSIFPNELLGYRSLKLLIKKKIFIFGVDITVHEGVKYLEDQNRRYRRDKMPPLRCRILKSRKISDKHVLNNNGQTGVSVNTFLFGGLKKLPVCKFCINRSPLPKLTFIRKMTKFTSTKLLLRKYRSF